MMKLKAHGKTYYKCYTYFSVRHGAENKIEPRSIHLWLTKEELDRALRRVEQFGR